MLSVRLSLISVPTTLIRATAGQYTPARQARVRNCTARTAASRALISRDTPVRPSPAFSFSRSAAVSPTVVHSTLVIQKQMMTSGTLFRRVRRAGSLSASVAEGTGVGDVSCVMRPDRARDHLNTS